MPQIPGSFVHPVSQDQSPTQRMVERDVDRLRWCVFGAMAVFAMMIIVMGTVTQGRGPWDWKYISSYVAWVALSVWFVFLNMEQRKEFVIRSLLYLASIGVVFRFYLGMLNISSLSIHLYIPICTDLGIFLGIGLEYSWRKLKDRVRAFLNSLGTWLAQSTPNSEANSPMLPLHNTPQSLDPPPPPIQAGPVVRGDTSQPQRLGSTL